jgi:hypothetical protein
MQRGTEGEEASWGDADLAPPEQARSSGAPHPGTSMTRGPSQPQPPPPGQTSTLRLYRTDNTPLTANDDVTIVVLGPVGVQ